MQSLKQIGALAVVFFGAVDAPRAQVSASAPHSPARPVPRPIRPRRTIFPELMVKVGGTPEAAGVGDFNGDGLPDLAVPNSIATDVSILLGAPGGFFEPVAQVSAGASPRHVAVGDVDGDGDLDLAVACGASGVRVVFGNGLGTCAGGTTYDSGGSPGWVELGRLDADADLDMVVANVGTNSIGVLLGNGDGTFDAPEMYAAASGEFRSMHVGDVDGDGDLDVVNGTTSGAFTSLNRTNP